ncbi:MAG: hypothetical protein H6982_06660 [Chromatiales bacterium]|nr:hypothetical protein [Chromatiales bacterium]
MRYRLSWRDNDDRLDTALAANRLLARGHTVWWCAEGADALEAGDYVVDCPRAVAQALATLGVRLNSTTEVPPTARPLALPRVALLGGSVSAYPYDGYYALVLARLGMPFRSVSGGDIAAGALRDRDLLVLPGGFSTWGLDAGEDAPGADAEVRALLGRGGACIGSCGGAFYLSSGRPGWTGSAGVLPRVTHEYLQSGVGLVTVRVDAAHPLRAGLAEAVEMPYYHGPVWEPDECARAPGVSVVARFRSLGLSGRLFIDNPLDQERFAREVEGRAAILASAGPRGRAVLFSPHPEMGDLVRKHLAIDGYVRRYLPVRGPAVLDATLRHYRPLESPSFRLVSNAVHWLAARADDAPGAVAPPAPAASAPWDALARRRRGLVPPADADAALGALLDAEIARLAARAERVERAMESALARPPSAADTELRAAWHAMAHAAAAHLARAQTTPGPLALGLLDVETLVCLAEAWLRAFEVDAALDAGAKAQS